MNADHVSLPPPLTVDEVRRLDRRAIEHYRVPGVVLMENAGRGVVDVCLAERLPSAAAIVCGKGNNGGDGFVIARRLDLLGWPVRVVLLAEPDELRGDAAVMCRIIQQAGLELLTLPQWDAARFERAVKGMPLLIDALLGTGSHGDPRPPAAEAIAAVNTQRERDGAVVLAVDVPSGLDCDRGTPGNPTIVADHTCTFVAPKVGMSTPAARPHLGKLHVVDIGAPRRLIEEFLPPRDA